MRFTIPAVALLLVGCGSRPVPAPAVRVVPAPAVRTAPAKSDLAAVRAADISILFVGNSHTSAHDLPSLVTRMIRFRHPQKSVVAHLVGVIFLEDLAGEPRCREEIETRPWKFVVLQAQKISMSGQYQYSRQDGIDIARLAKSRGATTFFFAEWGRRDVVGDGRVQEQIYREMGDAAGAAVAPVGRAWDLALAQRPDLPLYDDDGNHESALGAYLTACVLTARLTGESPAALAAFPYPNTTTADRAFLADAAERAVAP